MLMPRTSAQGRSTASATATTSVEDYAKTIYGLTEWDQAEVTASALAKKLGVSNPSVTLMIKKMAELGLVDHKPYAPVRLTAEGRRLALSMVRRHRLIETWLVQELDYGWEEVHGEAERLEHAVSETFVERLAEKLGHPSTDPHGDPIPSRSLTLVYPETTRLCQAPPESSARVEQVDDAVPEALRILTEQDVAIGSTLNVVSTQDGAVQMTSDTGAFTLPHSVAHAVRVSTTA